MTETRKEDVQIIFKRLCKLMGVRIGWNEGEWSINYDNIYGGYCIVEATEDGNEYCPLGYIRKSAADMHYTILMICRALEYKKEKKKKQ